MSFSITEPSNRQKWVAGVLVVVYAVITLMPLVWIIATGFKTPSDAIAYPPKVIFSPSLEGYAFSRFKVPFKDDLLFFILSTRMMPPIAVAIPIFLMYRQLGLSDTHLGMIFLYTAVNLSLSVWLLKGFIDEIPVEYEEAALIDGYTRFQAFYKVVLPQAATGIASTAIFCLIFAWNEYAFAALLTSGTAQTAPPFIPSIIGTGGKDWPAVAAGATIFLVPIMVFTILLRKHLLRGITFGAVRK
jgi:multiple sugar transport system permease protein